MTLHLKAVHNLKGTVAAGVSHILIDELVSRVIWFKLCDIALQLSIVCIDWVNVKRIPSSLLLTLFLNL